MITLSKLPAESQKVLQIQNWLKHKECSDLKALMLSEVAALQEKSSRLLVNSVDEPLRLADAQAVAEEASHLVRFVGMLERIQRGEHEFQRIKIGVSEKTLWQ